MSKTNNQFGCAAGTSTLTRATFSPGMLLQHADLEQLNSYTRDLSRLLFKSLFGCGVICGLKVESGGGADVFWRSRSSAEVHSRLAQRESAREICYEAVGRALSYRQARWTPHCGLL
jgi:hypothetical protein